MTAFIIDDEPNCTEVLHILLSRHCPEVQITGIFNDPVQALAALKRQAPQLLFLDIEMPGLNGFDLIDQCQPLASKVIFTTAYDQYAVRAFKFNALDYLLKPIDRAELLNVVQHAGHTAPPNPITLGAIQHLQRGYNTPERIALPMGQDLWLVEVEDIICGVSDGSYVSIFIKSLPKPAVISKSLRELEELLNNQHFFRAHNSYLVNLRHVQKIARADGGGLTMSNGQHVPVARSKKQDLMALIVKL